MRILQPLGIGRSGAAEQTGRASRKRLFLMLALAVLIVAAVGVVVWRSFFTQPAATTPVTVSVTWGNLDLTVSSSGSVQPSQMIDMSFQTSGQVKEVLVKPGERVQAGQSLARLDDTALQLKIQQAQADVASAQAGLDKARNGGATPQQIAQSQADVKSAQAQLDKARSGNTTKADIAAAEAQLRAAQVKLEALKQPSPAQVSAARLKVSEAESSLQKTRDDSSAAKTRAQLAMQQAVATLTQAQSAYSTAKQNWDYVQETGNDPVTPEVGGSGGARVANKLSDAQRQQYYDAFVQAEARLKSAEDGVSEAQVVYENVRQAEIVNIQRAEEQRRDAQQQFDALQNPTGNDLALAQAQVDQQRANLQKLRQGGTAADVVGAQAQVDRAKASLEGLTAPTNDSDIKIAEATLKQAQARLSAAEADLAGATLTAPFAGQIATVTIIPGSQVQVGGAPAITMIDTSQLYLTLQVGDSDVMQVKPDQPVDLSFETMPDRTFVGTVDSVAPVGVKQQNLTTYEVRVRFDPQEAEFKIGLTGDAIITVQRRENVIQVPNQALRGPESMHTVKVQRADKSEPEIIPVQTGLTNGITTEIVKCLTTNDQCLREGDQLVLDVPDQGNGEQGGDNQMIRIGNGSGNPSDAQGPPIPITNPAP